MMIVAEIGVNWTSMNHACDMMEKAWAAGADAVKFQVFKEEHIKGHPRFEELKKLILTPEMLKQLKDYADMWHIEFFATPFYVEAVDMLETIGVPWYKIRYSDNENWPLRTKIETTKKRTYISGKDVYCIPKYPPLLEEIQIPSENEFVWFYDGYSNHYPGMAPALLAVARGAEYVEIHVMDCFINDEEYKAIPEAYPIDYPVSWTFEQFQHFIKISREMEAIR